MSNFENDFINVDQIKYRLKLPNSKLQNFEKEFKYPYQKVSDFLFIVNIKDTIHYKTLENKIINESIKYLENNDYDYYTDFVNVNPKYEIHNKEIFTNLYKNFDINKLNKITLYWCNINKTYFVINGVHRLSILTFFNYFPDNNIPKKYFEIKKMQIFDNKFIIK